MGIKTPLRTEDLLLDDTFRSWVSDPKSTHASYWEQYIADHPESLATVDEAKKLVQMLHFKGKKVNPEQIQAALSQLNNTIDKQSVAQHKSRRIFSSWWHSAAAVLLFLIAFGAVFLSTYKKGTEKTIARTEITAPKGVVKSLILPDQSIAYLNAGSSIQYKADFSGDLREVFLSGEAWFDVCHDETKPFIVHTGQADVKVLGTAFNVRAYPGDNVHQVSLERGKIAISGENLQDQILLPQQSWLLLRNKNTVRVFKTNNIDTYSLWREGRIVFRNTSFEEIASILERSHDITFTIKKQELLNCHYTGEFSMEDDISKILNIISMTAPFEYSVNGRNITIQ